MNTPFAKNSSSKVLALWFIGTAMVLFAVISPTDEAATRTTPVGESTELQGTVIPSLYPEKLIALDLRKHIIKIQVRKAQIEKAVRHMGDIDNYFAQEVYIRWEEKMANQQIEVQVSELQIENAALNMDDIEYSVLREVNIPKIVFPSDPINEQDFYPIISIVAKQHEVDPFIVKAIIRAESSYNPKAVSNKGAKGLMQLMPVTARELGVKNSFDPVQNIDGGVRYFKMLLDRYKGNVKLALAAYNAGSGKVQEYNGIPPYKATRIYIKKVLKYQKQYTMKAKSSTRAAADSSQG
jgi:soluble lytic murein transglycosylase-like protein